jgi:hypothetical protein
MVGRLTDYEGHRTAGPLLRLHSQPLPDNVHDVIVSNTALLLRTRDVPCSNLAYPILTFFFVSWAGVRLSSLGTSATDWPIVPVCSSRWNENW